MSRKFRDVLFAENIGAGWLYFYIHFITEIASFYVLSNYVGDSTVLWISTLLYDSLAFVPQAIIGYASDKHPKIPFGIIGTVLMSLALLSLGFGFYPFRWTALILVALGNACVHINGAEVTLRASNGRLAHSAVFVAGGSFGVISGKLLAKIHMPFWIIVTLLLTVIPYILLSELYRKKADKLSDVACESFNYAVKRRSPWAVLLPAVMMIVTVRAYMGYGIPTSWNKTTWQTVLLFLAMGIGKAAGGFVADIFSAEKAAYFSAAAALPFLLFGDKIMVVSLIGVALFSMTMSITLGVIASVLKSTPGLAFGFTTIGLFLGTAPLFAFSVRSNTLNCIIITALTAVCIVAIRFTVAPQNKQKDEVSA